MRRRVDGSSPDSAWPRTESFPHIAFHGIELQPTMTDRPSLPDALAASPAADEEARRMAKSVPSEVVAWVETLHVVVDELASAVAKQNADRLQCREGCSGCCADGLTVFAIEAARIVREHDALLTSASPFPEGGCAFLGEGGECRIYAVRPFVCRTQGLPLRWIEELGPNEVAEARDICPLNEEGGPPLESLSPDACFALGPFEGRLSDMQGRVDGGKHERVALRALFERSSPQGELREEPKKRLPQVP